MWKLSSGKKSKGTFHWLMERKAKWAVMDAVPHIQPTLQRARGIEVLPPEALAL